MATDGAARPHAPAATPWRPAPDDPHWSRLRDAALDAVVQETLGGPDASASSLARLGRAVAGLAGEASSIDHEALLDLAADVGRHVLAKRILEDSLPEAVSRVSGTLERGEIGRISLEAHFHRTARMTFAPAPGMAAADGPVLETFVAGLLWGALAEAFNSRVEVTAPGHHTYDVLLGEGRDINEERST